MIAILKNKVFRTLIIGLSLTVLAPTTVSAAEDPFEPLNRRIFEFNEGADAILLKPVAV
ncbi:MAG: MlaA family lipoprotein, partial [Luminiphilus sp.]